MGQVGGGEGAVNWQRTSKREKRTIAPKVTMDHVHEESSSSKERSSLLTGVEPLSSGGHCVRLLEGREVGIRLLKLEILNVRSVFVRSFDPMKIDWYRARVDFTAVTCA